MLMSQLQDSNLRQSVMQYITQTANGLDKNMDDVSKSKALIETLARESVHNQKTTTLWKSRTRKSVAVGVVAVVLAITVQFLVNYFTNELSKESHVNKDAAVVSTDGKVVKTQMDEMKVGVDGALVTRKGGATIKTTPFLDKVALASSLPDATLLGLDEIVVYGDKGYTLQIKVQGFSRVPVLNSRCGNVVHFYTAWKGKVTLDSTDLFLDETTAAEFKNAGFSLATGGRRLAGVNSVDGFFKALEGLKASGKWRCADVPLPSIAETRRGRTTTYLPCNQKGKCESKYGKEVYGAEQLTGNTAASAVARKPASVQIYGTVTSDFYMKYTSAAMYSKNYKLTTEVYALHPGQELVTLLDMRSRDSITFQFASGKRSHCKSEVDTIQVLLDSLLDSKVDSQPHFEYLGTVEEEGRVLRHFRMMSSSSFLTHIVGDAVLPNAATDFWDVAESMQPYRVLDGDGAIFLYDQIEQSVSDSDVLQRFDGFFGACSKEEKDKEVRPTMTQFRDLQAEDVEYYAGNVFGSMDAVEAAAAAGDDFAAYLERTRNHLAMPDHCYETCKTNVDALKFQMQVVSEFNICGGELRAALNCLEQISLSASDQKCTESKFHSLYAEENYEKCSFQNKSTNNNSGRRLEEEEEAEEEQQTLLLNTTQTTVGSRRLAITAGMSSTILRCMANAFPLPMAPYWFHDQNGDVVAWTVPWCWSVKFEQIYDAWGRLDPIPLWSFWPEFTSVSFFLVWEAKRAKKIAEAEFSLTIAWFPLCNIFWKDGKFITDGKFDKHVVEVWFGACAPLHIAFQMLRPPLYGKMCVGGFIQFKTHTGGCVKWSLSGGAFWNVSVGLDFWFAFLQFAKLEVGIAVGIMWVVGTACWWKPADEHERGDWNRRRWYDRRRRSKKECHTYNAFCTLYFKGYLEIVYYIGKLGVSITVLFARARIDVEFYISIYHIWNGWGAAWVPLLEIVLCEILMGGWSGLTT